MKQKEQYYSDLHTHTTASDGQYTPTQLVTLAAQNGLNILAITDHDTMDGLDEGIEAGKRLGITSFAASSYPQRNTLHSTSLAITFLQMERTSAKSARR